MPDVADLAHQFVDEDRTKQRQYLLSNTRARWGVIGFAVALLAGVHVAGLAPVGWPFILGFVAVFAGLNYAMWRVVRDTPYRPWYVHLNIGLGAALISVVLVAVGPTGHVLYVAYLIAPLQAALFLGPTEAWQALILSLTGFALATAIRVGTGTWTWQLLAQEALVLVVVCVALVPMLTQIVRRLRAAREALAQVERGDLTTKVHDDAQDELGYLGVSVNRTTDAIADIVRHVQHQAGELAAMAQQLAAAAEQLHASAEEISATAQQLSEGTERQRRLIGHRRGDSAAAPTVASQLHGRAQAAQRQIAGVAQQARRHGDEIAQASQPLVTLVSHLDQVAQAASKLEQGSREIGKLVDAITRIASQTDLLPLNAATKPPPPREHGPGFRARAGQLPD